MRRAIKITAALAVCVLLAMLADLAIKATAALLLFLSDAYSVPL